MSSGKTTFLKALAGQLTVGGAHLDGEVLYNGDAINSGKYLIGKVATYADEKEQHAPTLTVKETMEFAWKMTTGGHHSYGVAKDAESAAILDKSDKEMVLVSSTALFYTCFDSSFLCS
jgi:ABC-type multidrug transport system ATPase subunit